MNRKFRPDFGRELLFAVENTPVDYRISVDEDFLKNLNLRKGDFNSTNNPSIVEALSKVSVDAVECGGSGANVACGYASMGLKSAFAGSIGDDANAKLYEKNLISADVKAYLFARDKMNGVCYTLITPDGERTFLVHMGASSDLKPKEVSQLPVAPAAFLHSSAYALDTMADTLFEAIDMAVNNHVRVSFDMASKQSIQRHYGKIEKLLEKVDILFINNEEAEAFGYEVGKEQELIDSLISKYNIGLVAFKLGSKGAIISSGKTRETAKVMSYKVDVLNTNGAGDGFAAGLLYGLAKNLDLFTSGKVATYYASKVIVQHPARLDYRIHNIEAEI